MSSSSASSSSSSVSPPQQPQQQPHQARVACTSHGTAHPVESMIFTWVFGILMPAAALAWQSTKQVSVVVGVTLATPALAILQGAIGILTYRVYFGDAPLPQTPSHGVVLVHPEDKKTTKPTKTTTTTTTTTTTDHSTTLQSLRKLSQPGSPQRRPLAGLTLPSLGCECGGGLMDNNTTLGQPQQQQQLLPPLVPDLSSSLSPSSSGPSSSSPTTTTTNHHDHDTTFLQTKSTERPLRLLVVGDSLAIGVGQAKSATPIMPASMAQTLSKRLGGRVVYWTCHGAAGASTGWIVREMERGVAYLQQQHNEQQEEQQQQEEQEQQQEHAEKEEDDELESLTGTKLEVSSNDCSDTDDSSSDEESSESGSSSHQDEQPHQRGDVPLAQWKERLSQHGKRLDHPEVLGPYDIVVVLTGSNDLKSAFFPFLLTGEDAEFRRQAKERGGSYTKELRRLMETLHEKMQKRIQTIVHSVEVATESVRERVEETIEYIAPGHRLHSPRAQRRMLHHPTSQEDEPFGADRMADDDDDVTSTKPKGGGAADETTLQQHFPLVVLPGMPSRALPIFKCVPLRWLSIPIVDIMDMHKRNFAKAHPGEVLFVPPPSVHDLSQYAEETGEVWEQRGQEDVVLALRDIKRRDCRRIERDMRHYYNAKDSLKYHSSWRNMGSSFLPRFLYPKPAPISQLFSVDQVHPCDEGYDFWGRYIGNSIAEEMRKLDKSSHSSSL